MVPSKQHFAILDGLRGLAALVVLGFHVIQEHDLTVLPRAGFAVDFFYILSGFVVAYAYQARLSAGQSVGSFMKVRLLRLYPLLFVGVSAGILLAILSALTKGFPTPSDIALAGLLGLLLLPSFVFPQWPTAYPFNMAEWSLTFELWVNLVYALIAKRLTTIKLMILTIGCGVALAALAWHFGGIIGGNNQNNWHWGFVRVGFPFFAGVLLCRLHTGFIRSTVMVAILSVIFTSSLIVDVGGGWAVDLIYILLFFPAVVMIAAKLRASAALEGFFLFLGRMSYPIYILQSPITRLGAEVNKKVVHSGSAIYFMDAAQVAAVLVAAYLALRLFDEPFRKYIAGKWRAERVQAAAAAV